MKHKKVAKRSSNPNKSSVSGTANASGGGGYDRALNSPSSFMIKAEHGLPIHGRGGGFNEYDMDGDSEYESRMRKKSTSTSSSNYGDDHDDDEEEEENEDSMISSPRSQSYRSSRESSPIRSEAENECRLLAKRSFGLLEAEKNKLRVSNSKENEDSNQDLSNLRSKLAKDDLNSAEDLSELELLKRKRLSQLSPIKSEHSRCQEFRDLEQREQQLMHQQSMLCQNLSNQQLKLLSQFYQEVRMGNLNGPGQSLISSHLSAFKSNEGLLLKASEPAQAASSSAPSSECSSPSHVTKTEPSSSNKI